MWSTWSSADDDQEKEDLKLNFGFGNVGAVYNLDAEMIHYGWNQKLKRLHEREKVEKNTEKIRNNTK